MEWKPYVRAGSRMGKKYIEAAISGHTCLVRIEPLPAGYLWQVDSLAGYGSSIEDAKRTAEEMLGRVTFGRA